MCCEDCPLYEKCEQENRLKDNCCSKCPDYYDCEGKDAGENNSSKNSFMNNDAEDHSRY